MDTPQQWRPRAPARGSSPSCARNTCAHTHTQTAQRPRHPPVILEGEGAAGDVFVVELDDDVVVPGDGGQVGHGARPVLVVLTADLCLGWTLHRQGQTAWRGTNVAVVIYYFMLLLLTVVLLMRGNPILRLKFFFLTLLIQTYKVT